MKKLVNTVTMLLLLTLTTTLAQAYERPKSLILSATKISAPLLIVTMESILKEAYKKLGIKLQVYQLPPSRAHYSAEAGKFDGQLMRIKNFQQKSEQNIMVPVELYRLQIHLVTRRGKKGPTKIDDLKNYTACGIHGIVVSELIAKKAKEITNMMDIPTAHLGVVKGRCDFTLSTKTIFNLVKTREPAVIGKLELSKEPISSFGLYHYVHAKHKQLIPELTNILSDMKSSGHIDELIEKSTKLVPKN